ncbi:MAG: hypothetical protein MJ007_03800 [Paludibacteraceae bacterium]|nr:hypothetical protein [Paludibacteraceae bacterium]
MDTNIILSICQIVSVTAVPIIIWKLGQKTQSRQSKVDAKLQLFIKLMAKRNVNDLTQEWVDSLNVIEIVFQDDKQVCDDWKEYHSSLNVNSPNYNQQQAFRLQMLSDMAKSLGYKSLKQTDIANVYKPKSLKNRKKIKEQTEVELLRILLHSKDLASSMTEDEYKKHIELIKNS